jgi:hypothetical protein
VELTDVREGGRKHLAVEPPHLGGPAEDAERSVVSHGILGEESDDLLELRSVEKPAVAVKQFLDRRPILKQLNPSLEIARHFAFLLVRHAEP